MELLHVERRNGEALVTRNPFSVGDLSVLAGDRFTGSIPCSRLRFRMIPFLGSFPYIVFVLLLRFFIIFSQKRHLAYFFRFDIFK